jgi:enamine deaminase RidA (YjgF/YER057c/UK114 family)
MSVNDCLIRLGLALPEPPEPAANYVPWVISNGLVFLAGQMPKDGTVLRHVGTLDRDLTTDQGYAAAKLCALRLLSALHAAAGNLGQQPARRRSRRDRDDRAPQD